MLMLLTVVGTTVYVGMKAHKQHTNKSVALVTNLRPKQDQLLHINKRTQKLHKNSSPVKAELSDAEKEVNHYFSVASTSLALATVGQLAAVPALTLLSVPISVYTFIPFIKEIYLDVKNFFIKKPRITMNIVDGLIMTGMLATGSFLAGAFMMTFLWLSQKLLIKAEDHAQKSLIDVFSERPSVVWLVKDDVEISMPFEDLKPGDIIAIHAGELIPADGIVTYGNATIDQRILTGESQPAEKGIGSKVFASTVVLAGQVQIRIEKAGEDTVAAQIGAILNRTADFTKTLEWEWREVVNRLAPLTLLAGIVTWPILGPAAAVSMLVAVNFGYSMRVVAPLTLLNFLNTSSKNSILIKDGRALEILKRIDTIVFDKTGTLTEEIPTVSQVYALGNYSEQDILSFAAAAEYKQSHPVALAIIQEAKSRNLEIPKIGDAHYEIGYGLKVKLEQQTIHVGSLRFMQLENFPVSDQIEQIQHESHLNGYSLICVAVDNEIVGIIELIPTIRPEAKQIISQLKKYNMSLYIISGDHEKPTQKLAKELGIDNYFAEVLPEKKSDLVEKLQQEGKHVCFIGDGINDSIALKKANLSVSLQGASSVAQDSASIILMDGSLNQLTHLFEIAKDFEKNIGNSFVVSTIPTLVSIGGVLFLKMRVLGTLVLYFTGLGLGVANSMLPLIKKQKRQIEAKTQTNQLALQDVV